MQKSTPQSLFGNTSSYSNGMDTNLCSGNLLKAVQSFYLTVENIEQITEVFMAFMMKNKPTSKVCYHCSC